MGIIRYIKQQLNNRLALAAKPQMVYGYKNARGTFLKDTRISSSTVIDNPSKLEISDNVFIGHFNFIECSNNIIIDEGCQITNYISILSHSSHISIRLYGPKYRSVHDPKGYIKGAVYIGKYSFIGPHSTIMPNTKLGKGCLVGAYSMVSGEFPDFSIIKGNPAKVVGSTKDMDKMYLNDPELEKLYSSWASE